MRTAARPSFLPTMIHFGKKVLISLSLFISFFAFPLHSALAQSVGVNVGYGVQSLFNNQIPLDMNVTSPTSFDQVRVQWIIPFGLASVAGETTDFSSPLLADTPLYDHYVVIPQYQGRYAVTVNVSGVYSNGLQFSRSATVYLDIDSSMNLANNMGDRNLRRLVYVLISLLCLPVFVIIMKSAYKSVKERFELWLNKEA